MTEAYKILSSANKQVDLLAMENYMECEDPTESSLLVLAGGQRSSVDTGKAEK